MSDSTEVPNPSEGDQGGQGPSDPGGFSTPYGPYEPAGPGQPGYLGGYGHYSHYGHPQWGPSRPAGKVRRRGHPLVAAALLLGTVAASAAVTHEVWPSSTNASVASPAASGSGTGGAGSGTGSGLPGFGFGFGNGPGGSTGSGSGTSGSPTSSAEGAGGPSDVSSIAGKVDPDLVIVNARFRYQQAEGAGTGIVLTSTGEILTNNHVINGATSIKVTDLGNGHTYSANVVGYDPSRDVAVLQLVGASRLETAPIASAAAKVGQAVVAIGNAGGTGSPTPAGGSVTALDQSITASDELNGTNENLVGLIETNADVQSGDSGGPLVNTAGQVIGMDTAAAEGYSLQGQYSGGAQGYAIPIGEALSIARSIEAGQPSSTVHIGPTAFLGVMISSGQLGGSGFQSYGSYGSYGGPATQASGAQVAGVIQGGAAAAAGLVQGDTITAIDGQAVTSGTGLSKIVLGLKPGQTIQVTYTDASGSSHTVAVTPQSGPPA